MTQSIPAYPGGSRFTAFLIRENALEARGFKEWVFRPEMLFHAEDKWWGNQGMRDHPHEGLDLCLFRDGEERIFRFGEKIKIPAIYDGKVVKILNDFLGKSIFMEHDLPNNDNIRFVTIYGHTSPNDDLRVGRIVKQGEIMTTLAHPSRSNTPILPHLHLTIGWSSGPISYDQLNWETIGDQTLLTLVDPLDVLDGPYSVLEGNLLSVEEIKACIQNKGENPK